MSSVFPPPPGTVTHHLPSNDGAYIGSPSLERLPDGAWVASHDLFGPKTREYHSGVTEVFRSDDEGNSWRAIARLEPCFWANLFVHDGSLYLLGLTHHHGLVTIRRSDDGGHSWTEPKDTSSGLITPYGQYHTGPMPMLIHRGRIWRALEDATASTHWGLRYNPLLISAPLGADLLRRDSWIFSSMPRQSREWLGGKFGGWLEGNAVALPDGTVADVLRIDYGEGGKAALVTLADDGHTLEFCPQKDIIDLPGGATKFAIRQDPVGGKYWTLANAVPPRHAGDRPAQVTIRNTLALMSSEDLRSWEIRHVVLHHPDAARHGFQYVDWLFDGDDIAAVSRTAWEDEFGGAPNEHDANFLTFHRLKNFRALTLKDSTDNPFAD
jgi:hypothetical protein